MSLRVAAAASLLTVLAALYAVREPLRQRWIGYRARRRIERTLRALPSRAARRAVWSPQRTADDVLEIRRPLTRKV